MSASPIDFDPLANIRNIVRIVGEDTEAINYNELAYSADEASAVAFNDTLTAQCSGTNSVFVTSRPSQWCAHARLAYDLQGQCGGYGHQPAGGDV